MKTRIVLLGGGFAGVYTAMYLEQLMKRHEREQFEISLVSRENYMVFQPLLPEVISGTIGVLNAISPIRRLARRTTLYTRQIEAVDLDKKQVHLAPGFRPKPIVLDYDHLVIGLGTLLDYSKIPGMREHALPFKYLGDALYLRNHLVHVLEEADIEPDPEERRRLLTFVVAGGGFSGVETIAEMNDFLKSAAAAYQHIQPGDIRLLLLQSGSRILPELGEELAHFAHRILERRGVEIRLETRLKAVSELAAVLFDKKADKTETIPARTVVTTVPSGPHPLLSTLPCKMEGGRIQVDAYLAMGGYPGVWALGDCAAVPQPDGITSPPTAQHALRQARICAENILAQHRGKPLKPFDFTGLGKLGSLGRYSAVAEVMGIKLSGFLAWILWRGVYLSKFPGFERKIRILADWLHDIVLPKDITQIKIFHHSEVCHEHFEAGETLIYEGDFGDKVYFVARGSVLVKRGDTVLKEISKGELFGEIALISDSPRTATVVAQTATDVVSVSRAAFHEILAHVPGVKQTMESIMGSHLGRSVDLDQERLK